MPASAVTDADVLKQLSASPNALPSPSIVALELMRALDRSDAGMRELAQITRRDPALAARMIQLANSAIFAGLRPAVAVEEAVMRVGTSGLARMAVAISLMHFTAEGIVGGLDLRRFWTESIQRGLVFQHMAVRLGRMPAAEAFSLGLLSDVGLLAMAVGMDLSGLPSPSADLEGAITAQDTRFGFNFTDASVTLLRAWGFPPVLAESVRGRDGVEAANDPTREGQLRLCVRLCRGMQLLPDGQDFSPNADKIRRVAEHLNLSESDLLELLDAAAADLVAMTALFNITLSEHQVQEEFGRLRKALSAPSPVLDDPATEHVLVVSMDQPVRAGLREALLSAGHAVLEADSMEQALDQLETYAPRVVVLDWEKLGDQTAEQICQTVRSELGARLYLLVLSRNLDQTQILDALAAGANDVLSVPVLPRMLLAKVETGARATRQFAAAQDGQRSSLLARRELERRNAELLEAVGTDDLTGLANRRALEAFLQTAYDHAARHGQPLACIMFDLDHFKGINDRHGHDVGDRALCAVAQVMRAQSRVGDMVARYGGEEFLMLCPDIVLAVAQGIAERIRHGVEQISGAGLPALTVSVGVAVGPGPGMGPTGLLRAADQAMLQAKRSGRNQVCLAAES